MTGFPIITHHPLLKLCHQKARSKHACQFTPQWHNAGTVGSIFLDVVFGFRNGHSSSLKWPISSFFVLSASVTHLIFFQGCAETEIPSSIQIFAVRNLYLGRHAELGIPFAAWQKSLGKGKVSGRMTPVTSLQLLPIWASYILTSNSPRKCGWANMTFLHYCWYNWHTKPYLVHVLFQRTAAFTCRCDARH